MGGEGIKLLELELLEGAWRGKVWVQRRVQCHGGPPWWKGMGNPECPQEWGHGSLKGYATVVRRRINELRMGFRRGSAQASTGREACPTSLPRRSGPTGGYRGWRRGA